jgi:hypothetical protein
VDPIPDGCPDYLERIKEPMDLGTILDKLKMSSYTSSIQWKQDLERVWSNAMTYHPRGSVFWMIAGKLKKKAQKLVKFIPKTEADHWHFELLAASKKVSKILRFNPPSVTGPRPAQPKHVKTR